MICILGCVGGRKRNLLVSLNAVSERSQPCDSGSHRQPAVNIAEEVANGQDTAHRLEGAERSAIVGGKSPRRGKMVSL